MHICKYCGKEYNTHNGLMKHATRTHDLSKEQILIDHFHDGIPPVCKCGCGVKTNIHLGSSGMINGYFRIYAKGHLPRVHNNWGHNQKAIDKSSETRRQQYANGERESWCKGLTKETDSRVNELAEKTKATINSNPVELQRRSQYMSEQWKSGNIVAEYGLNSHNWKGGTSSINNLIRANSRLYTDWIYPILIEQKFTCQECGSTKKLEVHHNGEQMSDILHSFVDKNKEYTFDEKRNIMNEVIDYHINNKVSGKTLCKECHKQRHPSYNT